MIHLFIAISGSSSGGHLAALTGTSGGVEDYTVGTVTMNLEGDVGDFDSYSSSVDAVVDFFGPTDFLVMDDCGSSLNHNGASSPESSLIGGPIQDNPDRAALANPITYVDPSDPPFMIFHGDQDNIVPACQSELLDNALTESGVSSDYTLVSGGGHGPGVIAEPYIGNMVNFLLDMIDPIDPAEQLPYNGTPHAVPGRIEAEEYDLGGEGVAYHEANSDGNEGEAPFRDDQVDIEVTGDEDGDYNVGHILTGEWLEYTIEVAETGNYDLDLRVATEQDNKEMHLLIDGVDITGQISIANTGGWQEWNTITVSDLPLEEGVHELRLVFDTDYFNLNYIEFRGMVTSTTPIRNESIFLSYNIASSEVLMNSTDRTEYQIITTSGRVISTNDCQGTCKIGVNLSPGVYLISYKVNGEIRVSRFVKY